ncbi:asparagine synthase (glutamine-hydrolyzing) [Sporomusa sp.]|uniref:asparagine synthase (glutamine-hydrolyzing) n=1 Tax=Sporomusa sp. TaxID=2078658 RepID=UPI002C1797DD|nr:asparagine synthase (glutamine-hydrolyzing) [Sporomusa sp.]HWR45837.1 asparagine synthase (glutamine-hydrolyzing) [Sporomusa sp.]
MCGIAGSSKITTETLKVAIQKMQHRGPDADGAIGINNQMGAMGHVRLAIIDLDSRSSQPMVCPVSGNVISFNGEIYNYRDIREELAVLGWKFKTTSDTEVLLYAYNEWGTGCLSRLNGMFAFSIYDIEKREIFVARDRLGKKPFYYTLWGGEFSWASELKVLLTLQDTMPRDIDLEALGEFMALSYIPGSLSIYKHVRKLLPGHFGLYDCRTRIYREQRYWSLPLTVYDKMEETEAVRHLEELLRDAVRLRLESDVPVGTYLSGGLDSSLITAIAAQYNREIVAFTAKFSHQKFDESTIADSVAKWVGVNHQIIPVEAHDGGLLDRLGSQFDEPFGDSSLLPTYMVSKAISKYVKVALSGDGGDELFAGYPYYSLILNEQKYKGFPAPIRKAMSIFHHLLPVGVRGKNFLRRLALDDLDKFLLTTSLKEYTEISPLKDNVEQAMRGLSGVNNYRNLLANNLEKVRELSILQKMTRVDLYSYLPDDILVKVDRASMYCSLEARAPMLDYRIVEFAYALPDHLRLSGITTKHLLKKVARNYLPPDYNYERKQGFNIPEAEWMMKQWRPLFEEAVKADMYLLDKSKVEKIQEMHHKTGRLGNLLFKIMMLAQFEKQYGVVFNE